MSQWEEIVRNVLRENHISLDEATIIRTDYYNNFNDGDKLIVIKNPSKEEYDNIKKNSKYNSVRGFVTKDDSVYVWDANLGIHQDVIDILDDENKKPYDVVLQFSQDENNDITVNSSFDSKRLNDLLDYKKSKYSNTNTLNAKDISNLNYYDFEVLYNGIYKKENEIIQEFANSYSYQYNFDFSKLDYDNKPYNEKDDFKTFMKKAKQIIAKENNINLDEARQVGNLYHTTSLMGILGICRSNSIGSQRYNGISFSRDKYNWYADGPFTLVIDGDTLSNNHKTYPFSFHSYFPDTYPGKDTNAETTVLPRGMKPSIRKQNDDGSWSGCDEIMGDQYFELGELHKYITGLMVNINNYDQIYDFEIEDLKQQGSLPDTVNTREEAVQYAVNLFKAAYPKASVEFVKHKSKDRSSIDKWSKSHRALK